MSVNTRDELVDLVRDVIDDYRLAQMHRAGNRGEVDRAQIRAFDDAEEAPLYLLVVESLERADVLEYGP